MKKSKSFLALVAFVAASCEDAPTGDIAECATCSVELGDSVILQGPRDVEAAINARMRRDQRGRVFVGPLIDEARIAVYSADGRFVRTLGRRGRGPGEFHEIRDLQVGRGDTLYILHDESISVFGPDSLQFVRSASSHAAGMARFLGLMSDGSVVTARTSTTSGGPAEDLIWVHRAGVADPEPGGLATTDTASSALVVRNDSIWLLRRDYRLFLKTPSSDWAVVLERPQWYAAEIRAAEDEKRGPPRVTDLVVGDDGRIMILSYVFAKEPPRPSVGRGEQVARQLSVSEWQSRGHYHLDVWDKQGKLEISSRVPGGIARFVDADKFTHFREDTAGNTLASVRHYRVKKRQ